MACYDVSPYTCTYDSGGAGSLPGGGNPDYSSLSTWEGASDNDLSGYTGPVILDCYDSQTHDNIMSFNGSSNTSSTSYRLVRSSPSCAIPWVGKIGSGASFYANSSFPILTLNEGFSTLLNLSVLLTVNVAQDVVAVMTSSSVDNAKCINIIVSATNAGSGAASGLELVYNNPSLIYNCIAYGCKTTGFKGRQFSGMSHYFINCTSCDNANGFAPTSTSGTAVVWNCYAADNSTSDFVESRWDSPSGWNASKDNTSDLGGTAGDNYKNGLTLSLDADYLPTSATNLYGASGAGENWGRNPYNDLSASVDFSDFLKNDAAGDSLSKKDIRGTDRPTPDTADASWAVGAAEYVEPPVSSGGPMMWIF